MDGQEEEGLEGDGDGDALVETGELLKVFTTTGILLIEGKWDAGYRMTRRTLGK